ncbi:MAG: hypothetical protein HRU13_08940 [Phycisphaerales bacterium]|nr:hypothetical protein [Phycisphaerales bacterium]
MTDTSDIEASPTLSWLSSRGVDCSGCRVLFPYACQDLLRQLARRLGITREDRVYDVIHKFVYNPDHAFAVDIRDDPLPESCGGLRELLGSSEPCLLASHLELDVVRTRGEQARLLISASIAPDLESEWGGYVLSADLQRVWYYSFERLVHLTELPAGS